MAVLIEIPSGVEQMLRTQLGDQIASTARMGLAVEAYRAGKLSLGQMAELLGISTYEADGVLKERGVIPPADVAGFDRELASLRASIR